MCYLFPGVQMITSAQLFTLSLFWPLLTFRIEFEAEQGAGGFSLLDATASFPPRPVPISTKAQGFIA